MIRLLLFGIASFAIVSVFAVLIWFMASDIHKRMVWPQIAKDFEDWSQLKGDVVFSNNYIGTDIDSLENELTEFGFNCLEKDFSVTCEYLTNSLMDSIYWKLDMVFQNQRKITKIRGYIHSVR